MSTRDFADVEAAWREYASLHPEDWEYLLTIVSQLSRYDKGPIGSELCVGLATSLLEKGETDAAFHVARGALKASQRTEGLRTLLVSVYEAKHASNANLQEFMEKAGLLEESGGLRQQIESLDRYLTFSEGAYVFHRGGWGYGVVVDFDSLEEKMIVDFQRKPGHMIKLLNATKILQRLPDDHIGVYKHYRREELEQIMKDEPARVFHLYLESHGGKATLKNVREELVPDVVDKTAWSRWWTKAKKALLKDPRIDIGQGSSPKFELRAEAKTIEQEVVEKMQAFAIGYDKVRAAREYLRSLDMTPELAAAVGGEVDEALTALEAPAEAAEAAAEDAGDGEEKALARDWTDESSKLALRYLKVELKTEGAAGAAEAIEKQLASCDDLVALLSPLEPADRKRAVQAVIKGAAPGWAEQIAALMRAGDAEIADTALDHLGQTRPDILINIFAELSSNAAGNPTLFLWYVKGFLSGAIKPDFAPGEKKTTAMEKLLTVADQIGLQQKRTGAADLKEFLRHLRSFFTSRRHKMFKEFVGETTLSYARYLYSKIQRNRGFTDQTKQALLDVVEGEHPGIHMSPTEEKKTDEVAPVEDVIYTTMIGYHKKEAELKHLIDVEVPKNAEDLGRAAAFGDISENAEYTAALEKQEQIMMRVRELREDLDRARILDPHQVTTDLVVVGTKVKLNNLTKGGEETYALLGPWDANVEEGVISYLSPVGRGLLGKAKGTTAEIQLPSGQVKYEILNIELVPEELVAYAEE